MLFRSVEVSGADEVVANWDALKRVEKAERTSALDGIPAGPVLTDDRKVALPPRHELHTSMESLIHHFKLVTEGFDVPAGEVYVPIESARLPRVLSRSAKSVR